MARTTDEECHRLTRMTLTVSRLQLLTYVHSGCFPQRFMVHSLDLYHRSQNMLQTFYTYTVDQKKRPQNKRYLVTASRTHVMSAFFDVV